MWAFGARMPRRGDAEPRLDAFRPRYAPAPQDEAQGF